ncbi:MAG: TRAP transporter small permease [Oliverpabstia sp.]
MKKIRNIVNKAVEYTSVFLIVVMVLLVLWQVIARYILNSPSSFSEALTRYMFVWLVLVTSTYAFGCREHMRIEVLLSNISGTVKKYINIGIEIITIVFSACIMTYGGSVITRMQMVQTDSSLHIPMGVIYSIIPICGVIIIFYCICNIIDECRAGKEGA